MMKKLLRKINLIALTLTLVSVPIFSRVQMIAATSQVAETATVSQNYIIKLHTNDPSALAGVASNIKQQFTFSNSAQFKNIYTFSSQGSLAFLRQELAAQYDYLDIDQPVVAKVNANDPGFTINASDIDHQWALPKVGFTSSWQTTTGSTKIVVAIIDTGVDETHEDLAHGSFVAGFDFLVGAPIALGKNSDDNGHGTLVSGIIGATANNGLGITGAAWQVTLMPIKALNASGSGDSSNISQAIVWAADHGAQVINMSLGGLGFGHDTVLANAISYAYGKNVLIVAAAGNDVATTGGNLDQNPVFPVCDDNGQNMVLGVTASDVSDVKPGFANFGKACIDVSAPGKRILSTINHDPTTGVPASNAYAYASGTSVAVPYVVAQAVLLEARFPGASNAQIRDRIITTADNIDANNLTQCGGLSCKGLLGAGRINVTASLAQQIQVINEGDVVRVAETGQLYNIAGGKRHAISPFVMQQRFSGAIVKPVAAADIANYPEGDYANPLDGTLFKMDADSTVYYMSKGLRLPVTYPVFQMRKFNFADVHALSYVEVNSWILGSFLAPPEGTLVRTVKNLTVYWVVDGALHPINYNYWVSTGLNIFPVVYMPDNDIKGFPKGDAFIK